LSDNKTITSAFSTKEGSSTTYSTSYVHPDETMFLEGVRSEEYERWVEKDHPEQQI